MSQFSYDSAEEAAKERIFVVLPNESMTEYKGYNNWNVAECVAKNLHGHDWLSNLFTNKEIEEKKHER